MSLVISYLDVDNYLYIPSSSYCVSDMVELVCNWGTSCCLHDTESCARLFSAKINAYIANFLVSKGTLYNPADMKCTHLIYMANIPGFQGQLGDNLINGIVTCS